MYAIPAPMLAKAAAAVPDPAKKPMLYEPKWDGFRCIVFRDGDEVELASRNTKPLTRYFPELVEAIRAELPERCVLDGEIFVAQEGADGKGRLQFEVLQERIHPAASRITLLSEQTPADFVAFDLLAQTRDVLLRQLLPQERHLFFRRSRVRDLRCRTGGQHAGGCSQQHQPNLATGGKDMVVQLHQVDLR